MTVNYAKENKDTTNYEINNRRTLLRSCSTRKDTKSCVVIVNITVTIA